MPSTLRNWYIHDWFNKNILVRMKTLAPGSTTISIWNGKKHIDEFELYINSLNMMFSNSNSKMFIRVIYEYIFSGEFRFIIEKAHLIIRNHLEYFDNELESIFTENIKNIFMTNLNATTDVTYRTPDSSVENVRERISDLLHIIQTEKKILYLTDDMFIYVSEIRSS